VENLINRPSKHVILQAETYAFDENTWTQQSLASGEKVGTND